MRQPWTTTTPGVPPVRLAVMLSDQQAEYAEYMWNILNLYGISRRRHKYM
jgi:hypothetical protein